MSFIKNTTFSLDKDGFEIIDNELIKTAAFKLPDGVNYDPDFLYMWVKAVSAGETWGANKNNDWFPREELKNYYSTFLTAHMFKNHENKQIENAIGDVLAATWDDDMDCVKLLVRIDSKIAPSIVRGFKSGYMTDVSMGCRVDHSVCSICGNVAKTPREYCDHVKYERGKIYDDGRKVYEINIGPKFHDISAVLNGAEKTAKVTGIYIAGDKIAYINDKKVMTKVASFNETFSNIPQIEKAASIDITKGLDIFPDTMMSKEAYAHKVAEIKKDIEGKIIGISENALNDELLSASDNARKIFRMCCENYWDEAKCNEIADMLISMADERGVSKESIFKQFLDVMTFTGCELAPKEFFCIFKNVFGVDTHAARNEYKFDDNDENVCAESCAKVPGLLSIKSMIGPAIVATRGIPDNSFIGAIKSPMRGISLISAMPRQQIISDDNSIPSICDMFRDMIKERSVFSPRIIKRTAVVRVNSPMFRTPAGDTNSDIMNALYMAYQNDRVNNFGSPAYLKLASETMDTYMEKTAGLVSSFIKRPALYSATVGLPLTLGYSALQRSRIRNGENVSSLNRYVAENPVSAYFMQALLLPAGVKGAKGLVSKVGKIGPAVRGKSTFNNAIDMATHAKVKYADILNCDMEKTATDNDRNIIDEAIFSVYNKKNQAGLLKMASVLYAMDKEDVAEYILKQSGLSFDDIDNCAEIAKQAIIDSRKKELTKEANMFIQYGLDAMPEDMNLTNVVLNKFAKLK